MIKRLIAITIAVITVCLSLTASLQINKSDVFSDWNFDFDDRILYGGYAVDVGKETVYSDNGKLFKTDENENTKIILEADAKYLNYIGNKLYFVSENDIVSCNPDGSNQKVLYSFDEEIKCLYVTENGIFYQRGNSVFLRDKNIETELLERDGLLGFVPENGGKIRWITENPDYVYQPFDGDEAFDIAKSEYLEYVSEFNGDIEDDIAKKSSVYTDFGTAITSNDSEYTGPQVKVGSVTLPLENHMPGTYFSKNGKACTCHNTSSTYCIQSVGNCNCMRYYPTGKKETCTVDLLGAQCFAFARMIFWTCFGFIDHSSNESLYYSVGSIANGAVTANSVKALLMKAAPGAHIRLAAGHSVSILTMDEDFIVIYHGNAGGDGVVASPCVVSTRRYTWEQFATATAKGILFVNMPYNYPDSKVLLSKKENGFYKLKANLNLRAKTNTESESLAIIPNGTMIEITEVDGFWGKTEYNGFVGWIFLEYSTFFSKPEISPSSELITLDSNKYLRAKAWKMTLDSFSEHFDKQSLSITSPNGQEITSEEYIGTGATVTLSVNGNILDQATVCIAGDINGNGLLDVGDYILAKRIYFGTFKPTDIQKAAADVSDKEGIDVYDYILIKRFFFNPNPDLFTF